jgi:hypothetical protein
MKFCTTALFSFFLVAESTVAGRISSNYEERQRMLKKAQKTKKPKVSKSKAPKGPTCYTSAQSGAFFLAFQSPDVYKTNPSVWICAGNTMTFPGNFAVQLPSATTCTNYQLFIGCLGGTDCAIQYTGPVLSAGDCVVDYSGSDAGVVMTATLQGVTLKANPALAATNCFVKFPGISSTCGASTVSGTWTAGAGVITPFTFGN